MECTVTLEVHLTTEHADVGSLERTVAVALAEVGRTLWRELQRRLEADLVAPAACPACGGPMKANGRAPRRLLSLAGEIELRRRRYRCTGCGVEVVPLDAALGLEPRTAHTLGVRERACWLVTELSYQKAVEAAAELRGLSIGRGELHRWVAEEGGRLEAASEAEAEAVFGEGRDLAPPLERRGTVWVSADGTMVHDRASGTTVRGKARARLRRHATDRSDPTSAHKPDVRRRDEQPDGLRRTLRRRLRPTRRLRRGADRLRLRRCGGDPLAPGEGVPDGDRAPRLVPPHRAAPSRHRNRTPRPARARSQRGRGRRCRGSR